MQCIVLAGVELISEIFHYQYPEKKKKKKKKKRNIKSIAIKLIKKPTNCLLRITIEKKNVVSILIFVLLWHFYFLFLKFTKKVHITHLLFRFVIDVWVLRFFIILRVKSLIGNRQWSQRDENGIGEMRGALILGIGWEEMWLWEETSPLPSSCVPQILICPSISNWLFKEHRNQAMDIGEL